MALFRNIFIFLFSSALAVFFAYVSFGFGASDRTTSSDSPILNEVQRKTVTISKYEKDEPYIQYAPYQGVSSGVIMLEFGRLATAFTLDRSDLSFTFGEGHNMIIDHFQGIVSLYDPFTTYTILPKEHNYEVKQITNGSFYIGNETDGTTSLYTIDSVVQLSFLDQGTEMTNMILFPGMYIRFDPTSNRELKGADLFRITVALTDEKSNKNTSIAFINPRVAKEGSSGEDVFFIANLPRSTKPLFQMLHLLFQDRIKQVDLIKSYATTIDTGDASLASLYNPAKKNHYLLGKLNTTLSRAVQSQMDPIDFHARIDDIYKESKSLVEGNSVQMTLERFLSDARFAIYGNAQNKFDQIYNETAIILKIKQEVGKGKLFQYLSDIYSKNIIFQKKTSAFAGIDTYASTSLGLLKTLDNPDIVSKDYFDIALYAYQIFQIPSQKDRQLLLPDAFLATPTYDIIRTIIGATDKYVQGLGDLDLQKSAYHTLVLKFYMPIANTLTRSLYDSLMTHDEKNRIFLQNQYITRDIVTVDAKLVRNVQAVYTAFDSLYQKIVPMYSENDEKSGLISFRNSLIRIKGFLDLLEDGNYKAYQQSPYVGANDMFGVFVPNVNPNGTLEIYDLVEQKPIPTPAPIVPLSEVQDNKTQNLNESPQTSTPYISPEKQDPMVPPISQ